MMMPFGWEGGTQVTVTLRGWSPETAGVSNAPGPVGRKRRTDGDREQQGKAKKKKEKNILYACVLIKEGGGGLF